MGFEKGVRRGSTWNDVKALDKIIKSGKFNLTSRTEHEFENGFANLLFGQKEKFTGKLISQLDQEASVKSVYCLGKKHRPDMTIEEDGIAIEIKYLNDSLDGFKLALGQSIIYKLRYKFIVNIIIISNQNKNVYIKATNGEEKDLEDILKHMADEMNVFSYLVPSFTPGPNIRNYLEFNGIE